MIAWSLEMKRMLLTFRALESLGSGCPEVEQEGECSSTVAAEKFPVVSGEEYVYL